MRTMVIVTIALLAPFGFVTPVAHACEWGSEERETPYWSVKTVDVRINNGHYGLDRLGLKEDVAEFLIRAAIARWNQDGGAHFRLRFVGFTERVQPIAHEVLVRADPIIPQDAYSAYFQPFYESHDPGVWRSGLVAFRVYHALSDPQDPDERDWRADEFYRIAVHELGHALGRSDLRHTNGRWEEQPPCPEEYSGNMVAAGSYWMPRYDRVWSQKINGTRAGRARLAFRRYESGEYWGTTERRTSEDDQLYRVGSASQNSIVHVVGFPQGPLWREPSYGETLLDVVRDVFNNNVLKLVRLGSGFVDEGPLAPTEGQGPSHPVGIAVATTAGDPSAMMVFTGHERLDRIDMSVCYRLSNDGGLTFGPEAWCVATMGADPPVLPFDASTSEGLARAVDAPSVAYNPVSRTYIVTWRAYGAVSGARAISIPSPASDTPSGTWAPGIYPPLSPSVACRSEDTFPQCLLAYSSRPGSGSVPPCLYWAEFAVDPETGEFVAGDQVPQPDCWAQLGSPSVAWYEADQRFYIAFPQDNETLFFGTLVPGDTRFVSRPTLAEHGYFSAPSLSTAIWPEAGGELLGWYLDYGDPAPGSYLPWFPARLADVLGGGLTEEDVSCLYGFEEFGGSARPMGEVWCPDLVSDGDPMQGVACGSLIDERCVAFDGPQQALRGQQQRFNGVGRDISFLVVWRATDELSGDTTVEVMSKVFAAGGVNGWTLLLRPDGTLRFYATDEFHWDFAEIVAPGDFFDGLPHVFAVAFSETDNTMRLIVDDGPVRATDISGLDFGETNYAPFSVGYGGAIGDARSAGEIAYLGILDGTVLSGPQVHRFAALLQ